MAAASLVSHKRRWLFPKWEKGVKLRGTAFEIDVLENIYFRRIKR